jgi:hypothetical protein
MMFPTQIQPTTFQQTQQTVVNQKKEPSHEHESEEGDEHKTDPVRRQYSKDMTLFQRNTPRFVSCYYRP